MKNNIVASCYFTDKIDPQRGVFVKPNDYQYMQNWYESILKLGMKAVVVHDNLSKDFVFKCTNSNVKFIKRKQITRKSCNDERFYIILDIVEESNYENVLITDIADVTVLKDPFNLIQGDELYIGHCGTWGENPILRSRYDFLADSKYDNVLRYNPGTIMGNVKTVKSFLADMCDRMNNTDTYNANLGVTAVVVSEWLRQGRIVKTGAPFVTKFRGNQGVESGCCVKHK